MVEVLVKEVETIEVMSLAFTGPYEQAPERLHDLMAWLLRVGHPYSGAPIALFFDDPRTVPVEELRAEICLPIAEECDGFEGIVRKELPGGLMATLRVEGIVADWSGLYEQIFQWMGENGHAAAPGLPCREAYVRCPGVHEEADVAITEILVPIQTPETDAAAAAAEATTEDATEQTPED